MSISAFWSLGRRQKPQMHMAPFLKNTLFGALAMLLLAVSAAQADDWSADKLRGPVVQLVDGQWQQLKRGMVVPDDRVVRTMAAGYVTFTRGKETVELGPNTQIQIFDKAGKKPFTTVKQYFGTVSVEAEVRNVQHFAVDTPFLAAVVKGTRFTVVSGKTSSKVTVRRGHVQVTNLRNKSRVLLSVGQSAIVDGTKSNSIEVSGGGKLPAVESASGKPLVTVGADGVGVNAGKLASVSVGSSGVNANVGNLADVNVGKSGIGVNVGGLGVSLGNRSSNSGSGSGNSGSGNSGSGGSGSGGSGSGGSGSDDSGSGGGLNVNVLGIKLHL
jgi:hypothetical protein